MISFELCASPHVDLVEARTIAAYGTEYTFLGQFNAEEGPAGVYTLTRVFADGRATQYGQYLEDKLATGDMALAGSWGTSVERLPFRFYFSRISQEALACRPSPKEFEANRPRALWAFALSATRGEVQRKLFSWSYLKERQQRRIAYLELLLKEAKLNPKTRTPQERRELAEARSAIERLCAFDDMRCFYTIDAFRRRSVIGPM